MLWTLLLVSALMLSTGNVVDPDLWGHVKYGDDLLAGGRLPLTATHTFTAPEYPWINHEVLSELMFAAVARVAGGTGLLLLKCLLGLCIFGVMIASADREETSPVVLAAVIVLAACNVAPGWTVRPQLFTWMFFTLMLLILEHGAGPTPATARPWLLAFLPPLFAAWVNAHGGFVAGLGILGAYLGCRSVEAVIHGDAWPGRVAGYALVLLACMLATLVNPYGHEMLSWLVSDLRPPRPEITEWAALAPSDLKFAPFAVLLALTIAALVGSRRRRDVASVVLLAVGVWQSVTHVRHVPFFAIMAAFWLPPHVQSLWTRWRRRSTAAAETRPPRGVAVHGALRGMIIVLVAALAFQSRALWVNKRTYPVEAFDYMAAQGLFGKLVVEFDWAQYAIAAFAPRTTVAFDGRFRTCYPQELADMHFDFLLGDVPGKRWRSPTAPPIDGGRVLDFGNPDLVLVSRQRTHAIGIMRQHEDQWTLLYQDALAQLWGRRTRYDDPANERYLPPARRVVGDRPQVGRVPWPALPAKT
jgi:hypothetical protein